MINKTNPTPSPQDTLVGGSLGTNSSSVSSADCQMSSGPADELLILVPFPASLLSTPRPHFTREEMALARSMTRYNFMVQYENNPQLKHEIIFSNPSDETSFACALSKRCASTQEHSLWYMATDEASSKAMWSKAKEAHAALECIVSNLPDLPEVAPKPPWLCCNFFAFITEDEASSGNFREHLQLVTRMAWRWILRREIRRLNANSPTPSPCGDAGAAP